MYIYIYVYSVWLLGVVSSSSAAVGLRVFLGSFLIGRFFHFFQTKMT